MVVAEQLLEDGDEDLEFPEGGGFELQEGDEMDEEKPPDLDLISLAEVEAETVKTEVTRLVEMGVLRPAGPDNKPDELTTLSTKMVFDWRWRQDTWKRRARLVARDYAWCDPFRTDVYAPAGAQSMTRIVPLIAQINKWKLISCDIKDAYLMRPQPRSVKVVLDNKIAAKLGIEKDWILGRILPGQREGAAEWYKHLKGTLMEAGLLSSPEVPTIWTNVTKTVVALIHVDDLVMAGVTEELDKVIAHLKTKYNLAVEEGNKLSFLKRSIEIEDNVVKIRPNKKYIEGLVKLLGGVKRRTTPGEITINDTELTDPKEIQKFRSAVGALLYIASDRPDVQFQIKELAGRIQTPTRGAMETLVRLVGYMVNTEDYHVVLDGHDPGRSFRSRAEGLSSTPAYADSEKIWLVEVACDSDWSGNKTTRASTSYGSIYVGGNWIFSFSRTQRNITLSSTEAEYVALVGGCSEGLLVKAVLVDGPVALKVYCDNNAAVAIANKEGVGRVKHLDGRLLWLQQRQGRDLELRRVDTLTNPADIGTKVLPGKRVKLLLKLMGFNNDWEDLGCHEFAEEKIKKETRERLKAVRKVVYREGLGEEGRTSTLTNQVAKRLMRLTLGALLFDAGEALGQSSNQYSVVVETSTSWTSTMVIFILCYVVVFLLAAVVLLLKVMASMNKKVGMAKKIMANIW